MLTEVQLLKTRILADGVVATEAARRAMADVSGHGLLTLADYATTSGIPLLLPGDVWVNAPIQDHNPNFIADPAIALDSSGEGFRLIAGGAEWPAVPTPVPDYAERRNSAGEPHRRYGITHTDRVRVSPVEGCACSCRFCDLSRTVGYATKAVDLMVEAISAALADPICPAKHVLVSGGTPRSADYGYLADVYVSVLDAFPTTPVDVMMLPIRGAMNPEALRRHGARELSINLELYGEDARRTLMPEKDAIPMDRWLDFIEEAVAIFDGNVRSLVILGLEPIEDTVRAVEALAERGCEPVLSPFRPHPATPLAEHRPPTADVLAEAYERSRETAERHGVKLGPKCIPCQHNTLTFPDDSGYYAYS